MIGGAGSQYGIYNLGTIQAQPGAQNAIQNISNIQGTVDGIYNGATGVISAFALPGGAVGIANVAGTISSITNLGSITGVYGIQNGGTITRLNNLQGGGTPLTYTGVLPTNYNVIVNSTSAYGKLSSPGGLAGATTFGVSSTSTLAANTYTAVLSGFTSVNLTNQVLGIVTGTLGAVRAAAKRLGGSVVTKPNVAAGSWGAHITHADDPRPDRDLSQQWVRWRWRWRWRWQRWRQQWKQQWKQQFIHANAGDSVYDEYRDRRHFWPVHDWRDDQPGVCRRHAGFDLGCEHLAVLHRDLGRRHDHDTLGRFSFHDGCIDRPRRDDRQRRRHARAQRGQHL